MAHLCLAAERLFKLAKSRRLVQGTVRWPVPYASPVDDILNGYDWLSSRYFDYCSH